MPLAAVQQPDIEVIAPGDQSLDGGEVVTATSQQPAEEEVASSQQPEEASCQPASQMEPQGGLEAVTAM